MSSPPRRRIATEFFVILFSILAAFAVEEVRDRWAQIQLRDLALSNIRAELEGDLRALSEAIPYHTEMVDRMDDFLADRSNWEGRPGYSVGSVVAPGGVQAPELRWTAWETASATGAVGLFDYELSQAIAAVYREKSRGVDATVQRLVDHVFSLSTFGVEDTEAVMRLMAAVSGELLSQELQLRSSIEDVLAELAAY